MQKTPMSTCLVLVGQAESRRLSTCGISNDMSNAALMSLRVVIVAATPISVVLNFRLAKKEFVQLLQKKKRVGSHYH